MFAVEEQEIATKYLINKRQREKHQPLVINVDFAKQISETSLISSVHVLWCQVGTTYR